METYVDMSLLEAAILQFCEKIPDSARLNWFMGRPGRVFKFNDELVVKRGAFITQSDADNQRRAFELLDPSIVRVPRVVHFFTHKYPDCEDPTGFLVMEYVDCKKLEDPTEKQIDGIVQIIEHMFSFKGTVPGDLNGGQLYTHLFDGKDGPDPGSIRKLNEWVDIRRYPGEEFQIPFVDFGQYDLVLCHQDIAPRNILWPADGEGTPWLIDWESAAYVPRVFEYAFHEMSCHDIDFHKKILSKLQPLKKRETAFKDILVTALWNNTRYYYEATSYQSSQWKTMKENVAA